MSTSIFQRASSTLICAPKASGVDGDGSAPSWAMNSLMSGLANDVVEFAIERLDGRLRCSRRHDDSPPLLECVAFDARLGERRQFGIMGERCGPVTAMPAALSARIMAIICGRLPMNISRWPPIRSFTASLPARYGTCLMSRPAEALQQLHRHLIDAADAGRAVIEVARLVARKLDELFCVFHRHALRYREHHRRLPEHGDRGEAGFWIERQVTPSPQN